MYPITANGKVKDVSSQINRREKNKRYPIATLSKQSKTLIFLNLEKGLETTLTNTKQLEIIITKMGSCFLAITTIYYGQ